MMERFVYCWSWDTCQASSAMLFPRSKRRVLVRLVSTRGRHMTAEWFPAALGLGRMARATGTVKCSSFYELLIVASDNENCDSR